MRTLREDIPNGQVGYNTLMREREDEKRRLAELAKAPSRPSFLTAAQQAKLESFFQEIDLPYAIQPLDAEQSLFEGVAIVSQVLAFDPKKVCPFILLHEAGHLALLPRQFWPLLTDYFNFHFPLGSQIADALFMQNLGPELTIQRSSMCDRTVSAWAYAATEYLGLEHTGPPSPADFGGNWASIEYDLKTGAHFGVEKLVMRGMAEKGAFPRLKHWTGPDLEAK